MEAAGVLVLGIGNVLWADEGFGVRAVEMLNRYYRFEDNVLLLDGGTQGLNLVHFVTDAHTLVIFDAIDFSLAPGTLRTAENSDVPNFLGAKKMSLHQTGFQEVLATAQLMGKLPENILLIGVQPEQLEDYGGSLTPIVREKLVEAAEICLAYLQRRGVFATRREQPLQHDNRLIQPELDMSLYESQRPPETSACRNGDTRFINMRLNTADFTGEAD